MATIDEGYIKFELNWEQVKPADMPDECYYIIPWRDMMFNEGLIRWDYDLNVGFGNISRRFGHNNQFIISGSQTANVKVSYPDHYALVTKFDIEANKVWCKGPVKASSESMTHAAIYAHSKKIKGIVHVHDKALWEAIKFKAPTSREDVPYGSPQMAKEIIRLFEEEDMGTKRIMAMAGHDEGVITFGKDLDEAVKVLREAMKEIA